MKFAAEKGFVQQLALLNHDIAHYINQQLRAPNINANNYFYLLKLFDHPNVTQSDFSTLVKLNQSTVTRAINSLVANGYIEKSPSTDKRSQLLHLTPVGMTTAQEIKVFIDNLNAAFLKTFKQENVESFFINTNAVLDDLQKLI